MNIDVCKKCSRYSGGSLSDWYCFEESAERHTGNHWIISCDSMPPRHCDKKFEQGISVAMEKKDVE
jgi:hypothetical protein